MHRPRTDAIVLVKPGMYIFTGMYVYVHIVFTYCVLVDVQRYVCMYVTKLCMCVCVCVCVCMCDCVHTCAYTHAYITVLNAVAEEL